MDDLISRQAAIEAIKTSRYLVDAMEKIIRLPSAQPEPKTGKWVDDPSGYKCSECGGYLEIDCGDMNMNFCPNCGRKMEVDNESDNKTN